MNRHPVTPQSERHRQAIETAYARREALRTQCAELFGAAKSLVFEMGCGHGHYLTAYAEAHPDELCVGIDLVTKRILKANGKVARRKLENLHFLKAELYEFLEVLPEAVRFSRMFMLFPDPWPKKRHFKRRMMQTGLLDALATRANEGTEFCLRTDDRPYFQWCIEHLDAHPLWAITDENQWPFESDSFFQNLLPDYQSLIAVRTATSE